MLYHKHSLLAGVLSFSGAAAVSSSQTSLHWTRYGANATTSILYRNTITSSSTTSQWVSSPIETTVLETTTYDGDSHSTDSTDSTGSSVESSSPAVYSLAIASTTNHESTPDLSKFTTPSLAASLDHFEVYSSISVSAFYDSTVNFDLPTTTTSTDDGAIVSLVVATDVADNSEPPPVQGPKPGSKPEPNHPDHGDDTGTGPPAIHPDPLGVIGGIIDAIPKPNLPNAVPGLPEPTTKPSDNEPDDNSASQTTTQTSTSSSTTSSSATATATPYMVYMKGGIGAAEYDRMCEEIDESVGIKSSYSDTAFLKAYATLLTEELAHNVSQTYAAIVDEVLPSVSLPDDSWLDGMELLEQDAFEAAKAYVPPAWTPNPAQARLAHDHMKLLGVWPSFPKDTPNGWLPFYREQPYPGAGSTIYILDSGCYMEHPEFAANRNRELRSYVVPNRFTLGPRYRHLERYWAPEEIVDHEINGGHGTPVASVAAGESIGVAPFASLVCVKDRNWIYEPGQAPRSGGYHWMAIEDAFQWIFRDVERQRARAADGKRHGYVINISWGWPVHDPSVPTSQSYNQIRSAIKIEAMVTSHIIEAWKCDIVVVCAGGNGDPTFFLDEVVPQALGKDFNELITVGGVDKDGTVVPGYTRRRGPEHDGSITVYAQAKGATVATYNGPLSKRNGTSYAAPQVVFRVVRLSIGLVS